MFKSFKLWLVYTNNSFQQVLSSRTTVVIFMIGKILRIGLFLVFLNFLFQGANHLAGYNKNQIIFFYLVFNLIDTLGQFLFREVYRFRQLVITGNLDFILLKPMNPLIRVLLGGADVMDFLVLIILGSIILWFGLNNITTDIWLWILFLILIINGVMLSAAFHIFVLGLGVITTSIDHLIFVYRDLLSMLRIPIDLYVEPVRAILTFIIPLGIMITFPAKVLMGILSPQLILVTVLTGLISMYLAVNFWQYCLRQYTSANS